MSLENYRLSFRLLELIDDDHYYTLIMTAMRMADSDNEKKLRAMWPEVWDEFVERYNSPGGLLPEEEDRELGIGMFPDGSLYRIERSDDYSELDEPEEVEEDEDES